MRQPLQATASVAISRLGAFFLHLAGAFVRSSALRCLPSLFELHPHDHHLHWRPRAPVQVVVAWVSLEAAGTPEGKVAVASRRFHAICVMTAFAAVIIE